MPNSDHWQTKFLSAVLLVVCVLAFFIFRPYVGALVVAATFAVIFHPLYILLLVWCGNRKNVAAALTTLLVLLIVILPLAWFGLRLWQEARGVYQYVNDPVTSLTKPL